MREVKSVRPVWVKTPSCKNNTFWAEVEILEKPDLSATSCKDCRCSRNGMARAVHSEVFSN
jgi:hypothetical protein